MVTLRDLESLDQDGFLVSSCHILRLHDQVNVLLILFALTLELGEHVGTFGQLHTLSKLLLKLNELTSDHDEWLLDSETIWIHSLTSPSILSIVCHILKGLLHRLNLSIR